MIILPNTPPLPYHISNNINGLSIDLLNIRSSLYSLNLSNYNESINFVLNLELYLQHIIKFKDTNNIDLSNIIIGDSIPWSNLIYKSNEKKFNKLKSLKKTSDKDDNIDVKGWSLFNELQMVLISLSLTYIRIGSEITNSIICKEIEEQDIIKSYDNSWKLIMNYYKKSISLMLYGQQLEENSNCENFIIQNLNFTLIQKIGDISIQLTILSKYCWYNRVEFKLNEKLLLEKNTILFAKVAIYIINELKTVKNVISNMINESSDNVNLNTNGWINYLSIVEKYANAYGGFFLSIQFYKENKIGNSIGLVQYSLLNLQSKKMDLKANNNNNNNNNLLNKFKSKFNDKRNEHILSKLDSISTLNIDKSIFKEKSEIILNDVFNLFDILIKLNLKFTKENNTLHFDNVIHYNEVNNDSKWPIGCKIPITSIKPFDPNNTNDDDEQLDLYSGKGAYY
ncbi:unnamed protein product [Candida verbasci]|uniref:Uncharacterized protein n=1 Tax=Candida verbasci TaxID=1227364 RepID=A0A9W4U160_9ASCO|nr:unnamed protein product [Candida verbasci]